MADVFIKCPLCKVPLDYRLLDPKLPRDYAVDCYNEKCKGTDGDQRFWGFAQAGAVGIYSDKFIYDYEVSVDVDNLSYVFWGIADMGKSEICPEGRRTAITVHRFYPLSEETDEEFFTNLIRKVLKLKAFT